MTNNSLRKSLLAIVLALRTVSLKSDVLESEICFITLVI